MHTTFDQTTRDELINRIYKLNENSVAQWGKMNVYQMVKHCRLWDEWIAGSANDKQAFIGRLFGKMGLKNILKDEKPLRRYTPTIAALIIKEKNGDIALEKKKWIASIEAYAHFPDRNFVHIFFGKMTKEQIGRLAYKHADHHLRQFNG